MWADMLPPAPLRRTCCCLWALRCSRSICSLATARSFCALSCAISSSLKGHALGMPGSLGSLGLMPSFLSARRFLRWCSLTLRSTLYFCFSVCLQRGEASREQGQGGGAKPHAPACAVRVHTRSLAGMAVNMHTLPARPTACSCSSWSAWRLYPPSWPGKLVPSTEETADGREGRKGVGRTLSAPPSTWQCPILYSMAFGMPRHPRNCGGSPRADCSFRASKCSPWPCRPPPCARHCTQAL